MAGIDHQTMQMNQFKSYVTMLADPSAKEDLKLKAAQEISENFEVSKQVLNFALYIEI